MKSYPFVIAALHFMMLSLFPLTSSVLVHDNFTDLSALLAFKAHLSDPYKILSSNWTGNTSFCSWMGVSCDRQRQRVVSLDIENLPLHGTIAPDIGNLSFLAVLYLTNTSLVGTIPPSLGQMTRLRSLTLEDNQLTGSIPLSIFNMSLLTELYLGKNNLSGTILSNQTRDHSVLPAIQILSLSQNDLSGNIPSSLSECHNLRTLSLSINQFGGNIPPELGNLQQLRKLYLGGNLLTGTIPTSLGNLTNLVAMDISSTHIHGVIPAELGGLLNLQFLSFEVNYGLTGSIPVSLSNLSALTLVALSYNKLTGLAGVNFGNMPNLTKLILESNMLAGGSDFFKSVCNCSHLQMLALWSNELDGSFPDTIGNLSRLTILDVGNNHLVGTLPPEMTKMESLQFLSLENNRLHGSIPREFGQLSKLVQVFLYGNNLSGSLPNSVGRISDLERLSLGGNSFSSVIPQSMWNLTSLIELNLSRNILNGSLSPGVGNLKSLQIFDISLNQLSGEMPSSMRELQMVSFVDLSNNSFSGQIPVSFGSLINMAVLNLSCNNLSGAIPDSLANLRFLTNLNLSFNKLEGGIPNKGAFLNHTVTTLVGNAALCGASGLGFPPCSVKSTDSSPDSRVHLLKYILPAIAFIIVLVSSVCILFKLRRKRAKSQAPGTIQIPSNHRLISYHELVRATKNFDEENLLGMGSFGTVYKGCLDDGQLAAVKVLKLEVDGASRSFDVECSALRMVRHRNLVKIISTCSNMDFRALVLQFMPNGSLEKCLYSNDYCLNLLQRINIVIDVASALEYLHHDHSQVVLHRDLKPSNILLDEDMTARVSDFGIAKLLVGDSWSVTVTSAPGTIGYIAPEYASTGRISTKGDVYSFGILLLEIFMQRKPTDPMFVGDSNLRQWAHEAKSTNLIEIVECYVLTDGSEKSNLSEDLNALCACLSSIIELGLVCSRDSPKERPTMKEVVPKLQKIKTDYLCKFVTA